MDSLNDTIYLCNFKVSVDGDWLCLKKLDEGEDSGAASGSSVAASESPAPPKNELLDSLALELENLTQYPNYPVESPRGSCISIPLCIF